MTGNYGRVGGLFARRDLVYLRGATRAEQWSRLRRGCLVVIAEAEDVEPRIERAGRRCAGPPQYAVDMQVLDHQRRRRRLELREELDQSFIWAAERIAQTNGAVTATNLHRQALGAADRHTDRGGELFDVALQISRGDRVGQSAKPH